MSTHPPVAQPVEHPAERSSERPGRRPARWLALTDLVVGVVGLGLAAYSGWVGATGDDPLSGLALVYALALVLPAVVGLMLGAGSLACVRPGLRWSLAGAGAGVLAGPVLVVGGLFLTLLVPF